MSDREFFGLVMQLSSIGLLMSFLFYDRCPSVVWLAIIMAPIRLILRLSAPEWSRSGHNGTDHGDAD